MTAPYREAAFHDIVDDRIDVACPWCKTVASVEPARDAECVTCGSRFSLAVAQQMMRPGPPVPKPDRDWRLLGACVAIVANVFWLVLELAI